MSFETVPLKISFICFHNFRPKTTGFKNLSSIILCDHNFLHQTFEINDNKFLVKENPGIGFFEPWLYHSIRHISGRRFGLNRKQQTEPLET
jgi:hypothetical protein